MDRGEVLRWVREKTASVVYKRMATPEVMHTCASYNPVPQRRTLKMGPTTNENIRKHATGKMKVSEQGAFLQKIPRYGGGSRADRRGPRRS